MLAGVLSLTYEPPILVSPEERRQAISRFHDWLKARMEERGLGVNQLAEYTGIYASAISRWLNEKSRPSLENCYRLADYFKRDPDEVATIAGWRPDRRDRASRLASLQAAVEANRQQGEILLAAVEKLQAQHLRQTELLAEALERFRRDEPGVTGNPDKPELLARVGDPRASEAQAPR